MLTILSPKSNVPFKGLELKVEDGRWFIYSLSKLKLSIQLFENTPLNKVITLLGICTSFNLLLENA